MLCAGISKVQAQNDATLAGMILVYTNKAEKELKNQEKVMLMQTTGHVWTKEEVEGTTDLQREFNNYLNSFRSIVCYAAQIYGFYHEISQLTDNMGDFTKQLSRHSTGALAVALSTRRNQIYREMILNSVEIVNVTRNFAASLFRNIKYFTLRKLYLCRKWMQKRLQKTTTTGITLPNFDFLA